MNLNGLLGSLLSPTSGGSAPLALPPKPQGDDKTQNGSDPGAGVMAEISDAARSLWAQMQQNGVSDASFDMHLDLRQLGMSVDASGNRSMEGHALSVDLHVEAHQGALKTSDGQDSSFDQLKISFSLEQADVKATEQGGQTGQSGDAQPAQGTPATQAAPQSNSLIDGLKKLIDTLDNANGQPQDALGLGDLLAQIGHALEDMAKRLSDQKSGGAQPAAQPADQGQDPGQAQQYQEDVHIHAVQIQMTAVQDAQNQAA